MFQGRGPRDPKIDPAILSSVLYGDPQRGTANCGKALLVPVRKVSVDDYQRREAGVPFLNEVQFRRKLRKNFGFDEARCTQEWEAALRDPKVEKDRDTFGNVTVAKIKQDGIAAGRQVGSRRELREKTNHEVDSVTEIADLARGRVCCSPECHVFCSERFGARLA